MFTIQTAVGEKTRVSLESLGLNTTRRAGGFLLSQDSSLSALTVNTQMLPQIPPLSKGHLLGKEDILRVSQRLPDRSLF